MSLLQFVSVIICDTRFHIVCILVCNVVMRCAVHLCAVMCGVVLLYCAFRIVADLVYRVAIMCLSGGRIVHEHSLLMLYCDEALVV